jgi:valyl-tRNA synthetase
METCLRLLHPIMPFLTEEIWLQLAPMIGRNSHDSIMLAAYPLPDTAKMNDQAEADMQWLQALIGAVRNIRGEMGLGNARLLPMLLQNISAAERDQLSRIEPLFKALAKVESVEILADGIEPPLSSSSMIGQMTVFVPMKGLIDPKAEQARLQKDLDKLQKNVDVLAGKLGNAGFVAKAPAAVVDLERAKLAELEGQLERVKTQIAQIAAL